MNNLVIDLWNDAMNHYRDEKRNDNRPGDRNRRRRGWGGRLFALGGFLLLAGGLSLGAWGNYSQQQDVMATARHERDSVPSLRVATVEASPATVSVTLPGTTAAFAAANIYARATGYIAKRNVDIGDRVKAGDLLAQLAVPELEDQISQNEATLDQLKAALDQAEANRNARRIDLGPGQAAGQERLGGHRAPLGATSAVSIRQRPASFCSTGPRGSADFCRVGVAQGGQTPREAWREGRDGCYGRDSRRRGQVIVRTGV